MTLQKKTPASFEPTIDYVVVKIPRFTFEKFPEANSALTTSMKSVGEVMSIGRTFKESLQKAIRGLEIKRHGLDREKIKDSLEEIKSKLTIPNCSRIFNIKYALQLGLTVDEVATLSKIDNWFIYQIKEIVDLENVLRKNRDKIKNSEFMKKLKQYGFSDSQIGQLANKTEKQIRALRIKSGVLPVYKSVDTCGAEFESYTPYYYSTYE